MRFQVLISGAFWAVVSKRNLGQSPVIKIRPVCAIIMSTITKRLVRKKQLLQNHVPVSLRTLDSYIQKGFIPYIKAGGALMFDVDAVMAALKKLERKGR